MYTVFTLKIDFASCRPQQVVIISLNIMSYGQNIVELPSYMLYFLLLRTFMQDSFCLSALQVTVQ